MGHRYFVPKQKPQQPAVRPELLAPAGSIDAFHAAVDAGADAVYLGLNEANARIRAKNFSIRTLSFLVPYAHSRKVKVQVTLNTLVKQYELARIIDILYQIEQIGIDAVIVQDIGLAHIIKKNFPKLEMHASTQLTIHNSMGVQQAAEMGFRRVVLSRELTYAEMESIRKNKPRDIELEVFVHGALCYCISGLCLASSFMGGMSGNRGRCTQVCRRSFSTPENRSGFYFSPRDISLAMQIQKLNRIGINSLKIEGRMKGASYVHTVVSAFRTLIDSPENTETSLEKLSMDFGREKTELFFNGTGNEEIITGNRPSGIGKLIGTVAAVSENSVTINGCFEKLESGDRLRFHGQEGFEGEGGKIASVTVDNSCTVIVLRQKVDVKTGDLAFLVGKASLEKLLPSKKEISGKPAVYRESCPFAQKILREISPGRFDKNIQGDDRLYIKVGSSEILSILPVNRVDGIILCPESPDIQILSKNKLSYDRLISKLTVSFPPFIQEKDCDKWGNCVEWFKRAGVRRWMISNIGQRRFPFLSNDEIIAGQEIWCMNNASQQALLLQGISKFSYSPEDDIMNLKTIASANGFITVFGHIPLFVSRIPPVCKHGDILHDSKGNSFFTGRYNGLYYLLGSQPFSILHRRDNLHEAGIRNFVVDFSFIRPDIKLVDNVLTSYFEQIKIEGSSMFNHKAGLK